MSAITLESLLKKLPDGKLKIPLKMTINVKTKNNGLPVNNSSNYIQKCFLLWPRNHSLLFYVSLKVRLFFLFCLCLVHLLSQNLVQAYSNFLSMLNFLCILKFILVYSKVRFYYINWFIWVPLKCFEFSLKIWVYLKI